MTDYSLVLTYKFSGKRWQMMDFDYDTLEWLDDSPKPTREELDALWDEVQSQILLEKQAKEAAKQSAIQKLSQLGLTEEEAKIIAGV